MIDYHIHTSRCCHAVGTLEQYLAEAENKNLKEEFSKDEVIDQSRVVEQIVINPFNLSESEISKQENKVETVGNPEDNSKKKILI